MVIYASYTNQRKYQRKSRAWMFACAYRVCPLSLSACVRARAHVRVRVHVCVCVCVCVCVRACVRACVCVLGMGCELQKKKILTKTPKLNNVNFYLCSFESLVPNTYLHDILFYRSCHFKMNSKRSKFKAPILCEISQFISRMSPKSSPMHSREQRRNLLTNQWDWISIRFLQMPSPALSGHV